MKKLAIIASVLVAGLCSTNFSYAQQIKIGYIDSQELIPLMPEAKKADTALQKYQKDLGEQIQVMVQEFQTKSKDFNDKVNSMSDAVKEVKARELQDLQNRIQETQQGAEQRLQAKQAELLKPIYAKAEKAIKEVAKEKGYTHVFNAGAFIVVPDGDNLLPAVKAKLGIK